MNEIALLYISEKLYTIVNLILFITQIGLLFLIARCFTNFQNVLTNIFFNPKAVGNITPDSCTLHSIVH